MDPKIVKNALMGFELRALSEVCQRLAERVERAHAELRREKNQGRLGTFQNKMKALRKAVIVGHGSGSREDVPRELVNMEWQAIREILGRTRKHLSTAPPGSDRDQLASWLKGLRVDFRDVASAPGQPIRVPIPVPKEQVARVVQSMREKPELPAVVLHEVVGPRFGISHETVKGRLRKLKQKRDEGKSRASPATLGQSLLVCAFTDTCRGRTADPRRQARVLDALWHSGLDPFIIYYLVQVSHNLPRDLDLAPWSPEMLRRLCCAVHPESGKTPGPFTELLEQHD